MRAQKTPKTKKTVLVDICGYGRGCRLQGSYAAGSWKTGRTVQHGMTLPFPDIVG